ncbi:MAG: hypothetical protein IJX81_06990 [Clostridia bacterium]|nr:hypothetical protein [Clostridia bacterium]
MSKQEIVERILSDAREEAKTTILAAENKAAALKAEAFARSERVKRETEEEAKAYSLSVHEKKAAEARLESAKIALREKRKVLDGVYGEALEKLIALEKEDMLRLSERLLTAYAEEGDELVFAENFKYAEEVSVLPVALERKLSVSRDGKKPKNGFFLIGKRADKDLSFDALLQSDRESNEAALAAKIF